MNSEFRYWGRILVEGVILTLHLMSGEKKCHYVPRPKSGRNPAGNTIDKIAH